jgi:dihydrofolate reductase
MIKKVKWSSDMRKVIVLEHISLDGVIQAPGGPDEDPSGGFAYGGWIASYSDDTLGTLLRKQMNLPFDLLLGRTTFEIWEPYWPQHADAWPNVNTALKYVASRTRTSSRWQPSVFLNGDIAGKVAEIKQQPGPDLHVWGSSNLIQTLLRHELVDTFWLMIYPLTLGAGKKLFAGGALPAAFKLAESTATPHGVIVVNYERAGPIPSGS